MYRALVNGILSTAEPKQMAECPHCGSEMHSKCGPTKADHWAHKSKKYCDFWHTGKETKWHHGWKEKIGLKFSEKKIEKNGVYHIADIHIPGNENSNELIIEFQNSPISIIEVKKRDEFYGSNLIWVINGTDLGEKLWIDREFRGEYFEKWDFEPKYIFRGYPGVDIRKMYVWLIKVPLRLRDKRYKELLLKHGFEEDLKRVKEERDHTGYYGPVIPFHKYGPHLYLDEQDQFKAELRENIRKEFLNYISKRKIGKTEYIWKYARRAFSESKQPIFIDINNEELIQIQNGEIYFGEGKLVKKEYFLKRIYKKIVLTKKSK